MAERNLQDNKKQISISVTSVDHSWEKAFPGEDFIIANQEPRMITRAGNGASLGVPKEHLGKRAIIIVID